MAPYGKQKTRCRGFALLALAAIAFLGQCRIAAADEGSGENLIGPQDSAVLIDPDGAVLFGKNLDIPRVPASTLKILTALAALNYLGPKYRCRTEFYLDRRSSLIMKGHGDPMLISEVLADMAKRLSERLAKGPVPVMGLIMDGSYFSPSITVPGISPSSEPYDAPIGALNANFNTVAFARTPQGRYVTAEPQTPLTPFALEYIRLSGLNSGRILLSDRSEVTTLYPGHLIRHFLLKEGVAVNGKIRLGIADPKKDKCILVYKSPYPLKTVISRMLEFSNNFIANQLLVLAGIHAHGPPGNLEKGLEALGAYAAQLGIARGLRIEEGSGISRGNRISVRQMATILRAFEPYYQLMERNGREHFKTGTLEGVRTRAGYLLGGDNRLYRFAVFVNTPGKGIDRIMAHICTLVPD